MFSASLYTVNNSGWASVNNHAVRQDNQKKIIKDTTKMAVVEFTKAIANGGMLTLIGFGAAIVAFAVFKVAAVIIGILAFPTAIIPPIYAMVTGLGGLIAGGMVGALFTKKFGDVFFRQMKEHFSYSMHLFSEAKRVYNMRARV